MGNAAEVAAIIGGRRTVDGWLCRCPLPSHGQGHGDRNPSLLVRDGERAVLLKCFAGCEPTDVLAEIRRRGIGATSLLDPRLQVEHDRPSRSAEALVLWRQAWPLAGTLGERYLEEHRGLLGPHSPSLRFVWTKYGRSGLSLPALIAAVSSSDRKVCAVQVTYLRASDGRKAPVSVPRMSHGAMGGGAVKLAPLDRVLGLAEGVEDALAARHLTGVPCWAALGAARMHRVDIPPAVGELHIFADADEPGQAAADKTAAQHRHLRVVIRRPPDGFKDWAEVAMERASA